MVFVLRKTLHFDSGVISCWYISWYRGRLYWCRYLVNDIILDILSHTVWRQFFIFCCGVQTFPVRIYFFSMYLIILFCFLIWKWCAYKVYKKYIYSKLVSVLLRAILFILFYLNILIDIQISLQGEMSFFSISYLFCSNIFKVYNPNIALCIHYYWKY